MSTESGPLRVLHVDDDADLCDLAALHLERANENFDVVTETRASEGLRRVRAENIDCVVSDYEMPGMNGLEFLRAVREYDAAVPFILYTGKGSEEIASEAISAGVTDYLQKGTTDEQYDLLANRIEHGVGEVRAREALETSERKFSTLVANLPGMVYRCRNEHGWPMTFVSEGAEELSGYTAATLESGAVNWERDVIHEDDREQLWDQVQVALDADEPFEVTYRIQTANGEQRWMWERGRMVERSEDDVSVIEGFITDITPRRTREQELEVERQLSQSVIETLEDIVVVTEADGTLLRWNDRTTAVTGYSDAEIAEMSASEFLRPADRDRLHEALTRVDAGSTTTVEATLVAADGTRLPYEFRVTAVEQRDGEQRYCAIGRHVRADSQRDEELERYRTVIEAVGDPMYTLDATGRITFANEALAALTGYEEAELIGEPIELVMDETDIEAGRAAIQELLTATDRRHTILEMDVLTAAGERIPCEIHIGLLPTPDGKFRGTAGVIRDVSTRKERERRLAEFASVVSHDLRNPLEVLSGRVELARQSGDVAHLDGVERSIDRMGQLIEDLLRLAHSGDGVIELESVDLSTAATDAWQSTQTDRATLAVDGSGSFQADPGRLQALLENLFRNAIEHGLGAEDADRNGRAGGERHVTITVGVTDSGFFVADDGVGIAPEERERIFDRGYTTQRNGTGYGLAIVQDVVSAHGWGVEVTDSEDGGARFEFRT